MRWLVLAVVSAAMLAYGVWEMFGRLPDHEWWQT
jgi:hypothetical protein